MYVVYSGLVIASVYIAVQKKYLIIFGVSEMCVYARLGIRRYFRYPEYGILPHKKYDVTNVIYNSFDMVAKYYEKEHLAQVILFV